MYESGEDYLETILLIKKRNGAVRSIDIARELNYSKPSVSRAVGILKEEGYIIVNLNGYIDLTEVGYQKANAIYERHSIIKQFLIDIVGVSEENAEKDACRIEHHISDETFKKIKDMVNQHE